jgi:hypothetical protein
VTISSRHSSDKAGTAAIGRFNLTPLSLYRHAYPLDNNKVSFSDPTKHLPVLEGVQTISSCAVGYFVGKHGRQSFEVWMNLSPAIDGPSSPPLHEGTMAAPGHPC